MSFKNRTSEFAAAVSSLGGRSGSTRHQGELGPIPNTSSNGSARTPLLAPQAAANTAPALPAAARRSEFTTMAGEISYGIQLTSAKLEQLARLAKRRTLFDDRPDEISELTVDVKQNITSLNMKIRALQEISRRNYGSQKGGRQEIEHSENVVVGLQNHLAKTSQSFAEVLELRTENLRAQKERREQFSSAPSTSTNGWMSLESNDSALYSVAPRATTAGGSSQQRYQPLLDSAPEADGNGGDSHIAIDMQLTQQDMALIDQQAAYIGQRSTAVESIEQTIGELAQIFQQLGTLVAQQREQVMRIDDNVADIESNVDMARRELFKYWNSVSSNRMLMVKVFAVVIMLFFIFMFVL